MTRALRCRKSRRAATTRACGLCGASEFVKWWNVKGYDIGECTICGLVQVLQTVSESDVSRLYGEGFFTGENESVYHNYMADPQAKIAQFGARLDRILEGNGIRRCGALYEIGCAHGLALCAARARGWAVRGCELSEYAAKWAREAYGLDVCSGSDAIHGVPSESQDLVIMWDVIEHLRHPLELLGEIHRILKSDGHLIFATGDVRSLGARIYGRRWFLVNPPYHLFYFDHRSVRKLLAKAAFDVVRIENGGGHPLENMGRFPMLQWIAKNDRSIGWRFHSGPVMEVTARKDLSPEE